MQKPIRKRKLALFILRKQANMALLHDVFCLHFRVRDQAEELEATLRIVKIWSKHKDLQAVNALGIVYEFELDGKNTTCIFLTLLLGGVSFFERRQLAQQIF